LAPATTSMREFGIDFAISFVVLQWL